MTQYKNLFQPLELRHCQLDNRIVFGAHTANISELGLPGERHGGSVRAPLQNLDAAELGELEACLEPLKQG